jgi:2,3-bisphosphoglycerate-dependent phosphoglycerate mutase
MALTQIILVRHAESAPSPHVVEADWPLTETGSKQARRLVDALRGRGIEAVVSSPYRRAVETIRPFAEAHGLPVVLEPDLRERLLAPFWISDFEAVNDDIHGMPDRRLPGGESASEARQRFEAALHRVASEWKGRCVVVATHGAVIAHLMRHHHEQLPADYYRRVRCPHIFQLEWGDRVRWLHETTLDGSTGALVCD